MQRRTMIIVVTALSSAAITISIVGVLRRTSLQMRSLYVNGADSTALYTLPKEVGSTGQLLVREKGDTRTTTWWTYNGLGRSSSAATVPLSIITLADDTGHSVGDSPLVVGPTTLMGPFGGGHLCLSTIESSTSSGDLNIQSAACALGKSGTVTIGSGTSTPQIENQIAYSGDITISSGNSVTGGSGNIHIYCGSGKRSECGLFVLANRLVICADQQIWPPNAMAYGTIP